MRFFGNVIDDVVRDDVKAKFETPDRVAIAA